MAKGLTLINYPEPSSLPFFSFPEGTALFKGTYGSVSYQNAIDSWAGDVTVVLDSQSGTAWVIGKNVATMPTNVITPQLSPTTTSTIADIIQSLTPPSGGGIDVQITSGYFGNVPILPLLLVGGALLLLSKK